MLSLPPLILARSSYQKLWFDLQSMALGFLAIVSIKLKHFPQSLIKPAIIIQDVVENHFCQVRACNGHNNHPTWRLQETTQNTIRYGQTTISRKSNAGNSSLKKITLAISNYLIFFASIVLI